MEQHIQTASFVEMIVAKHAQASNSDFDIILDDKVTLQNYCNALIDKIFELKQSEFPSFINYQSNLVKDSVLWLNKLEKLIANNEALFTGKCALSRYNKLFYLIEKKRTDLQSSSAKEHKTNTPKRLINADTEDRHFSFHELKEQIEKMESFNEKILFLNEEIFEYRQADIIFKNSKLVEYDKQCCHLIEKMHTMRKMKADFENEQAAVFPTHKSVPKLRFNGNVNQLVDVFYQLQRELFVNGKPYLDGNTNDLVNLIVNVFVDKDGNEISPQTVETILKPSRGDKRPKPHKRLDIDKLL